MTDKPTPSQVLTPEKLVVHPPRPATGDGKLDKLLDEYAMVERTIGLDRRTDAKKHAVRQAIHSHVSTAVLEAVERERQAFRDELRKRHCSLAPEPVLTSRDRGWNAALNGLCIWLDRRPALVSSEMSREKNPTLGDTTS